MTTPTLPATQEALRRGTPRWAEQAIKAEAIRGTLTYLVNNHNMHAEAANTGVGSTRRVRKLALVEID